jgi:hypothetical protein
MKQEEIVRTLIPSPSDGGGRGGGGDKFIASLLSTISGSIYNPQPSNRNILTLSTHLPTT